MDIEALIEKHMEEQDWYNFPEDSLRAALTEQAEAYEERIRQLEAERVPDYTGGDAELLKKRDQQQFTETMLEYAWCYSVPLTKQYFDRFMSACREMLAASPRRCHLCNYQHGHKIGCVSNPVDIALRAAAPAKEQK